MTLDDWLKSGAYLPEPLRDFHDQKDVFKSIAPILERRQQRPLNYMDGLTWVGAQVFTIDLFLWFMATHGWTLQRSRQRLPFDDLDERLRADREARLNTIAAALMPSTESPNA